MQTKISAPTAKPSPHLKIKALSAFRYMASIPFWGYLGIFVAVAIIWGLVSNSTTVLALLVLLTMLMAMARAIVWALKLTSFLLTAFFTVFVIIAFFSLMYQLFT